MDRIITQACRALRIPQDTFEVQANNIVNCTICQRALTNVRSVTEIRRHIAGQTHLHAIDRRNNPDLLLQQRLTNFIATSRIDDNIYRIANGTIECLYCHKRLTTVTLDCLRDHNDSQFHTRTRELKAARPRPTEAAFAACSSGQNAFSMELVDTLMTVDIPLHKLRHQTFSAFLEKYTQQIITDLSALRQFYAPAIYQSKLQSIRDEIGIHSIFISVDEVTDSKGQIVAHAIIRPLIPDRPGRPRLIHAQCLDAGNGETIRNFVIESLNILWPDGIHYNRVLIYCTDAAPYMMRSGRLLAPDFPKMLHVRCLCHSLSLVAEWVRDEFDNANEVISETKKVFIKAPTRVRLFQQMAGGILLPPEPIITRWGTWLRAAVYYAQNYDHVRRVIDHLDPDSAAIKKAKRLFSREGLREEFVHIAEHYIRIADAITRLEAEDLPLNERITIFQEVYDYITQTDGIPDNIITKMRAVYDVNTGYQSMRNVNEFLRTNVIAEDMRVPRWELNDYLACRYASLESVDVERSFSKYKSIFRSNRHSFLYENLCMHVIVCCFTGGFVHADNDNEDVDENIDNDR
ncbi:uncharacterized protein LOC122855112 [Aphidius gifuensis]|uniref:uncharacterized protein LOC122855112 n=1 Tax=Aphidius gifuensis TaxID=684658 RepID=UPI001CDCF784|nr:uncharacterized protein LOC122855112 [Aphidius gifuensis]